MVMHFAVAIKKEFDLFLMIGLFVVSGVVGWFLHSYEFAFGMGIVLTLLFY